MRQAIAETLRASDGLRCSRSSRPKVPRDFVGQPHLPPDPSLCLRRGLVLITGVLISAVAAVGLALPASAYTYLSTVGLPGGVTPYQVVGTHFQVPCGGYACFQPGLTFYGPLVSRSDATVGAQTVHLNTHVYRWDWLFAWVSEIEDNQQLTLQPGAESARFADRSWLPNTGGAKYVTFALVWLDPSGQTLGGRGIAMNQNGDYVCQTRFTLACTAYPGWITATTPQ